MPLRADMAPIPPQRAGCRALYLAPFALAALLSWAHALLLGTYNGDFSGYPVALGSWTLAAVLLASLAPFALLAALARWLPIARPASPARLLPWLVVALLSMEAFFSWRYGVAVMDRPKYSAPPAISLLIQASNRINPYILLAYLALLPGRWFGPAGLGIAAGLLVGLLRRSLIDLPYLGLAIAARWWAARRPLRGRKLAMVMLVVLVVFALAPSVVGGLYRLRDTLRGAAPATPAPNGLALITGRLAGRFSSFSDTATVIEHGANAFRAAGLTTMYFPKQVLGGAFGAALLPAANPEHILITLKGPTDSLSSYMLGIPGQLYLGWQFSRAAFVVDVAVILATCLAVFALAPLTGVDKPREFALICLAFPMLSGVGGELATTLTTVFFLSFAHWLLVRLPVGHEA